VQGYSNRVSTGQECKKTEKSTLLVRGNDEIKLKNRDSFSTSKQININNYIYLIVNGMAPVNG